MLKKVLLLAVPLLLAACSAQPAQPANEITVEMTDFTYSKPSLTVAAGQPVTLTLVNTGNIEHDFVVEEIDVTTKVIQDSGSDAHHAHGEEKNYDLHASAGVGDTTVLEFIALQPGTYKFFCSVEGHEAAGMVGELTVLDQE
ncbi:MAG TPA: cupredoxin domain-containing protein [Anaerolineales bacterium]|nr:cupredoxin domain-containing protein [Anaerolineales bacterium]